MGRQSFRRCGGMCNYAMVDVLPTLARQWASLGASHAPRSDVPIDSPRVAASLNTFAHLICESKQLYLSVCISISHNRPKRAGGASMYFRGGTT